MWRAFSILVVIFAGVNSQNSFWMELLEDEKEQLEDEKEQEIQQSHKPQYIFGNFGIDQIQNVSNLVWQGRVYFRNETSWVTICMSQNFSYFIADFFCQRLKSSAYRLTEVKFLQSYLQQQIIDDGKFIPSIIINFQCFGNETSLDNCTYKPTVNCSFGENVVIDCKREKRLQDRPICETNTSQQISEELKKLESDIQSKDREIQSQQNEILIFNQSNQSKDREIQRQLDRIQSKDREIQSQLDEILRFNQSNQSKDRQIQSKDSEIQSLQGEIQRLTNKVVRFAVYGKDSVQKDVTAKVQQFYDNSRVQDQYVFIAASNDNFGDPAPYQDKQLSIYIKKPGQLVLIKIFCAEYQVCRVPRYI